MTEREFATEVTATLQRAGFTAYWAGGCVRDELLGLVPDDYDIATDATPSNVQALFPRTLAIGASFGVIEVLGPRVDGAWRKVQVATFRTDGPYSDSRRPDSVTFSTARDDALRRDFTINGLFFDPIASSLHDFVGGQEDLKNRLLRAIGDPVARLTEDNLRILRAARMTARFDLTIDAATLAAGRALAPQIVTVSPERIAEELRKLLSHASRSRGVEALVRLDLLQHVLPEVDADRGLRTICLLPENAGFALAMATLVRGQSAQAVHGLSRRLRLSNSESEAIAWLLATVGQLHGDPPPSRAFPILAHPLAGDLLDLELAICKADGSEEEEIVRWKSRFELTPQTVFNPPLLLRGEDLIALGLPPGPSFKRILDEVRSAQLDGKIFSHKDAQQLAAKLASGATTAEVCDTERDENLP